MNDNYTIDSFSTSTGKLWYAGTSLLPGMAERYSQMSRTVWASRGGIDNEFQNATSPVASLPMIYEEWDRLRTTFQDILASTATNLVGTGNALCQWSEELTTTDTAGAAQINAAAEDIDRPAPPPAKPSTDAPPTSDRERGTGE